jgi:regulator of sirC expression with transglutaminase-like and TPR domain
MNTRDEALEALARVAAQDDDAIDLAETALALAALDRPRVSLDRYRDHLIELAAGVRGATPDDATLDQCVAALNAALVERHGYQGDTQNYDDLQNANLMRVIDRKRGLPVALSILYLHAGRAQGWAMAGVNFPGHFLIRLDRGAGRAILDPFHGGRALGTGELRALLKSVAGQDAELTPAHYAPLGNRDILLRLQNNIKLRQIQAGQIEAAVATLEGMLAFAPAKPELWREAGLLRARLGQVRAALDALERFTALETGHDERFRIATLMQELKSKLN